MVQYFIASLNEYSAYQLLWFFVIYSFGGWCLEVAYHVVTTGKFINRGFLNGPVCPIYGFGMLIVIICLEPARSNPLILYIGSVILTTLLELVVGFLLEKLFHERWWDYSGEPFNLNGYICLKFSLEWGLACMIVIDIVHVFIAAFVDLFPQLIGWIALAVCLAYFVADTVVTILTILKLNKRLARMNELGAAIRRLSDACGEHVYDMTVLGIEKNEELKQSIGEKKLAMEERNDEFHQSIEEKKLAMEERNEEFRQSIEEKKQAMEEKNAAFKQSIEDKKQAYEDAKELEELREKLASLKSTHQFGHGRLIKAFPQMHSTEFAEELEELKEVAKEKK